MNIFKPGDRIYVKNKNHFAELSYALDSHNVKYSLHTDNIGKYIQIEKPTYCRPVLWIEDSLWLRIWHFFKALFSRLIK